MSIHLDTEALSPPPVPGSGVDTGRPAGDGKTDSFIVSIVETESEPKLTTREMLFSATALGYYLSLLMHVGIYVITALGFLYFGNQFFQEDFAGVNVRARLDDRDVIDDNPFEKLPEVSMIAPKVPSRLQQATSNLQAVENGLLDVLASDEMPSLGGEDSDADSASPSSFLFRLPEAGLAVTKGSFTAWTSPQNPMPRQNYQIIIEVRLPNDIEKYRLSDLTGTVKGSDSFERRIPYDGRQRFFSTSFYTDENNQLKPVDGRTIVQVRENKIQLVVTIPGGENEVRDTIKISSRRLKEKQELELVFGKKN